MSKHNTQNQTTHWHVNIGDEGGNAAHRSWDDCRKYGFLQAGGGTQWQKQIKKLQPGDTIFAYSNTHGYVGMGTVITPAKPQADFHIHDGTKLLDLPLLTPAVASIANDPNRCDWCVQIRWHKTVDREDAVLMKHFRRKTVMPHRKFEAINDLVRSFS
ncbi:MAG: hypothetical protein ACF8OB_10700 [Phycisphaeraceae bacterium JB051]